MRGDGKGRKEPGGVYIAQIEKCVPPLCEDRSTRAPKRHTRLACRAVARVGRWPRFRDACLLSNRAQGGSTQWAFWWTLCERSRRALKRRGALGWLRSIGSGRGSGSRAYLRWSCGWRSTVQLEVQPLLFVVGRRIAKEEMKAIRDACKPEEKRLKEEALKRKVAAAQKKKEGVKGAKGGAGRPPPQPQYGDEKVANRDISIRVWHGATEKGP
jgi:hypothetical protein